MSRHHFFLSFRSFILFEPALRRSCQQRTFSASPRIRSVEASRPAPQTPAQKQFPHRLPEGRGDEEFEPKMLGRPIGFKHPPKAGDNSGKDTRSLSKKREDFVDYDKHIEKRKDLQGQLLRPYFMDHRNMKYQRGKAWIGNARLFKAKFALYFPNFHGFTLESSSPTDTTTVLNGKVSIVSVYSSQWGSNQVETFVGKKENPAVEAALAAYPGVAQRVDINVEENWLKQMLLWLFKPNLRKVTPKDRHGKYFIVTKGVSNEIRETIGLIANAKVGYVYLVDEKCRIRWAACADASEKEKRTLSEGVHWLVDERNKPLISSATQADSLQS
ncbi:hypothetical protein EJ05DRAFT_472534 [Pseudovirgaria hyperparasitica]|uniref:Uncharacterized protein n=1 Tax=Pseudovirgaria hyperparasitica TaxID=470096 RepID=A0A6A6WFN5_9PEZI|nr:uncharacterized protein EJ05DRAFT_472534 [Pseudovirgaria hyperparasitica]KAF2761553.1 hypothetical protein EJ05DRAFT_472534 [Pseudovirgaria hyperparasitica]